MTEDAGRNIFAAILGQARHADAPLFIARFSVRVARAAARD